MANTKRKPEETPKRSPGKSKFVFPKREAPPVDNTYFDRLFSELQQQETDSDAPTQVGDISIIEEANRTLGDEELADQEALNSKQSTSLPHTTEISETTHFSNEAAQFNPLPEQTPLDQDLASEPSRLEIIPESVAAQEPISPVSSREDKHILVAPEQALNTYCKPETSSYVDRLKLKFRLSKGEANVLRYLLGATHDKNQGECFITIPKLAEAASLTTRGCQLALKNLQMRGFIVRAEEYDPTNRLGIKLQVNLISL
jgi:hypothetical protein